MTSDIICIHQGEDGTVCGEVQCNCDGRRAGIPPHHIEQSFHDDHRFVPGRKCPTCDGSGIDWRKPNEDGAYEGILCPTCADSPVRGYVELAEKEVE